MNQFDYGRIIKFADTDSAGVVYFANLLSICHEAYEAYLVDILEINLRDFFQSSTTAIPIIHGEIDFLQPLFCGDHIIVTLSIQLINQKLFEIQYQITRNNQIVAQALTRHICIHPQTRKTQILPDIFLTLI